MSKKWMAALAVPVLAVTGVGVASAQSADDDIADDATSDAEAAHAGQHERDGRRGPRPLMRMAEAIGIESEDLREALESGQTLAEIAEENGADIDQIIEDMVAEVAARAEEQGHDDFDAERLSERLTELANRSIDPSDRRPGPGHRPRGASEAVEELLGLEGDEIRDALRGGQTLAEIAEEQGVSLDELVSTIVDDIETRMGWVLLEARERGLTAIPYHAFFGRLHDAEPDTHLLKDGVHATNDMSYAMAAMSFVAATGGDLEAEGVSERHAELSLLAEDLVLEWATLTERP